MEKLLNVSSSPHVRDKSSTKSIMRDVCIALIPATLVGIGNFGVRALLVILTTCTNTSRYQNRNGIIGSPSDSCMEQVKIFPVGNKKLLQVQ